jgi:hypothetical protein
MKVFISSTSVDLAEYRQAAYEVCNRLQIVPIGMEQFESMGVGASAGSTQKLDDADVYVGIFANRYGYIEPGHDVSVTEVEFDHAGARGLDRLCFVSTDAAGLPVYPENQDKLDAFKTRVGTLVIRNTFGSPWEFKYLLYDSLLKWMFRQRGASPLSRTVFNPLFVDHSRFGGRQDVLDTVQAFIESPGSGYLVITAPAGYGKTALATQIVNRHRDIAAYHFFTTLYGSSGDSEFLSELFFLRNVTEQVRLWHFFPYDTWTAPTTLSGWVTAYQHLFTMTLRDTRLLVLDGLDEVRAWSLRPYLTSPPGDHLKVILTIRDVGQNWADEYGLPTTHTTHFSLSGLTRDDVAHVLRLAGTTAATFADDAALLDRVVQVTSPSGTVTGSDPLYVTFLADDLQHTRVTTDTLGVQPRRLEDYLADWWKQIVSDAAEDSAALDLLGTLAAALGPIRRDDLITLHASLKRTWTKDPLETALTRLRRTVAGTATEGYSFAHPRFREHVRRYPEVAVYEGTLRTYCARWKEHQGRYALEYAGRHFAEAHDDDTLLSTVLDPAFQASQHGALGSSRWTLSDLALATARAADADRVLDVLRCASAHRRLARGEGLARTIFRDLANGQSDAAGRAVQAYAGGPKSSGVWTLVLRCYLLCATEARGDAKGAASLAVLLGHQLGLSYHGASHYASELCDALIARAVTLDPALGREVGIEAAWAVATGARLTALPAGDPSFPGTLGEVVARVMNLEQTLGENPSAVEFIDEERAGEDTMRLRDALIAVAAAAEGRDLIDRALKTIRHNPYPRYRDNGLVALAIAALAVPDWDWAAQRLETILETGLEQEGVAFTVDLAAHLAAEADARGFPSGSLGAYLARAAATSDRWGTSLRTASARAAAAAAQGRTAEARALLSSAVDLDSGFAGYATTHLLALAARWCELGDPAEAIAGNLPGRAAAHATRVRDPQFNAERQQLVRDFETWFAAPTPEWPEVAARLRMMPDPDVRRAYKDLVSARWSAEAHAHDWGQLVIATLADATALDTVLGRLWARAIRQHHAGARELPNAALIEAIDICARDIATSRPWDLAEPAYA